MADFEKAYEQLKRENERLQERVALLEKDVSNGDKSKAKAREFESRYRALFGGSMEAMAISQGQRILDANRAFLAMFGYENLEECAAKPIIEHVAPESRELVAGKLERAARGQTRPTRYEIRILCEGGNMRDVEVFATEINAYGEKFIQSAFRDITERKAIEIELLECRHNLEAKVRKRTAELQEEIRQRTSAEDKLVRERNLLRTLIDNVPDVIYVKDVDSRFTICNKACVESMGLGGRDAMLGRSDCDFFDGEAAARFRVEEEHIMRTGTPVLKKEESGVDSEGNRVWSLHTKIPFVDDRGETIGIIGIAHIITPQKEAQIALAEERNLLRTLIDNIPDEIYVKDCDGRFVMCNKAAVKGMQVENEEDVIGKRDIDFYPGNTAAIYMADEEEILRTGQAMVNKEESALNREGKRVWFRTTKAPLVDGEGRTVGLIGIGRNITGQKEAEVALTEERNILRIMIDNLPGHLYVKDAQHRFTTCNLAVEQRHGHSPIGQTDFELYPRQKAEVFYAEEEQIMRSGKPLVNKDQYAFNENGDLKNCCLVNKFPLRDTQGNVSGLVGISHDITEIKRAERALEEERNVLRTLIDNLPDHIYVKDMKSRFTTCNLAVEQAYGRTPIGETDFDLYQREKAEGFYAKEQEVMATGKALLSDEHYMFDESGAMVCCWSVSKFPLRDAEGNMVGIVGINHDVTESKRAQRALVEERNLLRTLIDNLPDRVYVKDTQSRFTACNKAMADVSGRSPVGLTDFDFYPKRLAQQYFDAEQEAIRTGEPIVKREEYSCDQRGVPNRWVLTSKLPFRNSEGLVRGIVGINYNITEQKLAEQAVRKSEKKYRSLVENIPDVIWTTDINGRTAFISENIVKIYGYSSEEICSGAAGTWPERIHPEDVEFVRKAYGAFFEGKQPFNEEYRIRRKDGGYIWVRDRATAIHEEDGVFYADGLLSDITKRKEAEAALRESEEKYRTLVENSPDGIVISGLNKIKFVNTQAAALFGYESVEEMQTAGPFDLVVPEQRQLIIERATARIKGKNVPSRYEFTGLRKEGTTVDIDICAAPIAYKGEKAIQMLMRDVTERNQLRAEIAAYREKILQAEKNAYVNSIGATVAHQLNQPLTVINLLLEETLSELGSVSCPETVRKHINDCLAESRNASAIITKFRSYAKDPHFEVCATVNLREVLGRIVAALSESAQRARLRVVVDERGELPMVEASTAALEQVCFLLIQNAIQAADRKKQHRLSISIEPHDKKIEMRFADDCGGITPENMDKIFEPFFTTKAPGKGTGLGLTIVKRILLAHGGKIRAESKAGQGSTFCVLWPLHRDGQ